MAKQGSEKDLREAEERTLRARQREAHRLAAPMFALQMALADADDDEAEQIIAAWNALSNSGEKERGK